MYIVIEIQAGSGSAAVVPPQTFSDRNAAESAMHQALSTAAVSSVEKHSVLMLDDEGHMLETRCYLHESEQGA